MAFRAQHPGLKGTETPSLEDASEGGGLNGRGAGVVQANARAAAAFPRCSQKVKSVSCSVVSDSATLWTVACQAPLSMEYWSG